MKTIETKRNESIERVDSQINKRTSRLAERNKSVSVNCQEFFKTKRDANESTIQKWETKQAKEEQSLRREYKQLKALYSDFKTTKNEWN